MGILAIVITIGGIIAGVVDRLEEKKREKKARIEKKEIHKPYGVYEKYFKRPLDFILSAWLLIVLSPLLFIMTVLVRIKLGRPVLFEQKRPGKGTKVFTIHKFRTMTDEKDENGVLLPDTIRLTSFGKKLRSSSLDELPELLNIVKGDMSIIGPRPLLIRYLPAFTEVECHRHDVRPGLSGLAQINGRNFVDWNQRLAFDVEYVNKITLLGDAKIMLKTIKHVIKHDNVAVNTEEIDEGFLDEIRGMAKKC